MQLHEVVPLYAPAKRSRVGRGGKRGKTSGRGVKGQGARAGHRIRPEMRDFIKKLPKLRGHGKNRADTVNAERERATAVNLAAINKAFAAGDTVDPKNLVAKGILTARAGKAPMVKILGTGDIEKKLTFKQVALSKSAEEKIKAAGGEIL
jgi:large subunit ribosomal protein L15